MGTMLGLEPGDANIEVTAIKFRHLSIEQDGTRDTEPFVSVYAEAVVATSSLEGIRGKESYIFLISELNPHPSYTPKDYINNWGTIHFYTDGTFHAFLICRLPVFDRLLRHYDYNHPPAEINLRFRWDYDLRLGQKSDRGGTIIWHQIKFMRE